jgi:hypothetical protein
MLIRDRRDVNTRGESSEMRVVGKAECRRRNPANSYLRKTSETCRRCRPSDMTMKFQWFGFFFLRIGFATAATTTAATATTAG